MTRKGKSGIPLSVMKHIAVGAGAASARSGKGDITGGGMGGRHKRRRQAQDACRQQVNIGLAAKISREADHGALDFVTYVRRSQVRRGLS